MATKLEDGLTLFAAASLARILVLPEKEPESTAKDQAYSMTLFEYAGIASHNTSFWKIPRRLLGAVLDCVSKKLPKAGTMRNGLLYRRESVARRISAIAGGAFANVPTPTVKGNYNRKGLSKTSGDGLATWVSKTALQEAAQKMPEVAKMKQRLAEGRLPTPTKWDADHAGAKAISQLKRDSPALSVVVMATETGGGKLNPDWVEWLMAFPIGWTDLKD